MTDFHQSSVSALSFNQSHNGLLVSSANHSVTLLMSNSPAQLNLCRTLANRSSNNNLPSSLSATGITLLSFPLAFKILPKNASTSFLCVDVLIKRFMGNWQLSSHLLWAQLLGNAIKCCLKYIRINAPSISAGLGSLKSESLGLLGAISAPPNVSSYLSRNRGLAPAKVFGNVGAIESFFHEAKNLISFSLLKCL